MNTQIKTELVEVTPDLAKIWLASNVANRPINKNTVTYYSKQMQEGFWTLSGQTLSFSNKNTLIDGQHRLSAVIESGCTIPFLIAYNVPIESFINYDNLKARGIRDVFAIEDIPNYSQVSSIINSYRALTLNQISHVGFGGTHTKGGKFSRNFKLSNIEMLNLYNENKELIQELHSISVSCQNRIKLFSQTQLGAIMLYLIMDKMHNVNKVYSFFRQLHFNENVENRSIYNLREKLISGMTSNYQLVGRLRYIFLVKCWNAYILGKEIKLYKYDDSELMPTFI
jgi:hypothetical protein